MSTAAIAGAAALTQHAPHERDALGLMEGAARAAAEDAGAPALLARVGLVLTPEGTWEHGDPGREVARRIGAGDARTVLAEVGVLQQTLLTRACAAVADGHAEVVLVVGGEDRARARAGLAPADRVPGEPDERLRPTREVLTAVEIERGLAVPAHQYAVIETAIGRAAGRHPAEHARATAERWAAFSAVAAANPAAWTREPVGVDTLLDPRPPNRWVAWPYTKLHVSQWTVDQAAAVLIAAPAAARSAGVDPDRLVFALSAAQSDLMVPMPARAEMHRSPAFELAAGAALRTAGVGVDEVAHLDLYSCFPSAVALQAEALGIDRTRPDAQLTLTGGMSFAGGPLNNAALMAVPRLVERIRAEPASTGMVTSVSGMFTKPGVGLWTGRPPASGFRHTDLTSAAEEATATLPVDADLTGDATVAGFTVVHDREGPATVIAVVGAGARRGIAVSDDRELAARLHGTDLVGEPVEVAGADLLRVST